MADRVDMKVVLLGKEHVGKTALAQRCLHERFNDKNSYQATIGAAFGAKRLLVNGKPLVMGIWDTAGSERYEAMSRIYYRGARAAVVCYDISERKSFERVKFWIEELRRNEANCKLYICGTKKDLIDSDPKTRQVDFHDATDVADDFKARLYETSSKSGEQIDELFMNIAEDYVKTTKISSAQTTDPAIQLNDSSGNGSSKRKCAC